MTSLTALTHADGQAAPVFNANFYITAATIIPVLFLALAVQGPAYRKALHRIWMTFLNALPDRSTLAAQWLDPAEGRGPVFKVTFTVLATVARLILALALALVLTFGIAVIAAGGYGELLAVYALYQVHDQDTTRLTVLVATMLLIILIVTGPLVTYLINAFGPEPTSQQPQQAGISQP